MPPRSVVLSFSGSGHLLCYQLGVAQVLLGPQSAWAQRIKHFAGASGGAIAAAVCALLPRERAADFADRVACQGRSFHGLSEMLHGRGPFADGINDAAIAALSSEKRLFLSATHCRTGRNALFANFDTAAELQRCVLASAAIPKSLHPFDLLRSTPPTYPEAGGIIVDPKCEHDGGEAASKDTLEGLPYSPHGEAYVDGGATPRDSHTVVYGDHVVVNPH